MRHGWFRSPVLMAPEFALLVECCRLSFHAPGDTPAELPTDAIDWRLFLALARRHRVEGLVARALQRLGPLAPEPAADTLNAAALKIAADNLANCTECARIDSAFASAGLARLFVKGVTLGELAYGNPLVKMGWDIDLLVAPGDIGQAAALLAGLGYAVIVPGRGYRAVVSWHRTNKESVWRRKDGRYFVELHSRLADNRALLPAISASSPAQMVKVASGICLPTLARAELFAYLTVHGAASNWFRLKWAADLAGLVHGCTSDDLVDLAISARELGTGRCAEEALLVCASLFGGASQDACDKLASTRGNGVLWLARNAKLQLYGPKSLHEPTERRFGTVRMHAAHLLLGRQIGFAPTELSRKIVEQVSRWRFA